MLTIPQQPFGFVAGRWVLSMADTPLDADRAPDYKPLDSGTVIFKNKLSHRVVSDGQGGSIGIVKTRYEGKINENGQLVDAEENEFIALPVGVYTVSFSFGQYSWPQFDFELTAEHTLESPFWLPSESPIPSGPGVVKVVSEEARLAAEAAAASAWEAVNTPGRQGPPGIQGPIGSIDGLAGAPRLTNKVHDITWTTSNSTIGSQTPRLARFIATAQNGYIRWGGAMAAGNVYYFTAEVKSTSDQVYFGTYEREVFHSGSGAWERLTGLAAPYGVRIFQVRDTRSSGWDQIEVRDPVLIDLTAVFGAGREPTKEYMDALLAKHGNYIGSVDQFAVGDAFQDQTVAGPGMGLRLDTSVGTRVMLDHPGGSTMLYGDTGNRKVNSLLKNGWTANLNVTIRRVNDIVVFSISAGGSSLNGSAAESNIFLDLPVGFRPTGVAGNYATLGWLAESGTVLKPLNKDINSIGSSSRGRVDGVIVWSTIDVWPLVAFGE